MREQDAEKELIKNKVLFTPEISNKKISHIAIYFKAGSVDDGDHLGITHLIEHMLFKGTEKRNYFDIISALESNGCDINAYTTKEAMVVHASFLNEFYKETIEILGDIISNPSFPEIELKKEKTVIIDEIRMYRDNPGEKIYDDFEAMLFKGTPLEHEITGTISSVKKINRDALLHQYSQVIKPGYFIIVNSDIPQETIISLIDQHFIPSKDFNKKNLEYTPAAIKNKIQFDESSQTHIIIGCRSYPVSHPLRPTASLLANFLGGAAMSSYLNLILREQMGLTYSVETSMNNFSNTGIFYTYYTCDPQKEKTSLKILKKIFLEFYDHGMSDDDLQKAKNQLKGQIAIHFESGLSWTLFNAKFFHYYSNTITFEELMASIENINKSDMNQVIKDHLNFDQLFSITIKKKKMNKTLVEFAETNSDICQDEITRQVIRDTYVNVLYPQMLTYPLQAGLLRSISLMLKPECIFEIGTFTGLGTICLAEGLSDNGEIYTFEKNEELEERIKKNFERAGIQNKAKLILGNAKQSIQNIDKKPDLIYIDADKEKYGEYFKLLFPRLKEGGWIIADNVWWDGKVVENSTKPSKETKGIIEFLDLCRNEKQAYRLLLPMFDGMMIIQKQSKSKD